MREFWENYKPLFIIFFIVLFAYGLPLSIYIYSVESKEKIRYGDCVIVTHGFYEGFVGNTYSRDKSRLKVTTVMETPKGHLISNRINVLTTSAKVCDNEQEKVLKQRWKEMDDQ